MNLYFLKGHFNQDIFIIIIFKHVYFPLTCSSKYISPSPPVILLYCYSKVFSFLFSLAIYILCVHGLDLQQGYSFFLNLFYISSTTVNVISKLKSQSRSDFLLPLYIFRNVQKYDYPDYFLSSHFSICHFQSLFSSEP